MSYIKLSIVMLVAVACAAQMSVPLDASHWQEYTKNGPVPLTNCCGGALTFDFPVEDGTHHTVDYLFTPVGKGSGLDISIYHNLSMSLQIATTGSPVFNYVFDPDNTCVYPAHVRLYFEQTHDRGASTYRWWSNPISYELAAGQVTITVSLTPDQWSDVSGDFGTAQLSGFQDALRHTANVGMTFGGGCFFGHGVNVSGGTAQFLLLNYGIT